MLLWAASSLICLFLLLLLLLLSLLQEMHPAHAAHAVSVTISRVFADDMPRPADVSLQAITSG
jgi:hypothetical protein